MNYFRSIPGSEFSNHPNASRADDTPIPYFGFACRKCMEVYSGDVYGRVFEPDETPEEVSGTDLEWSVMKAGDADNFASGPIPRLAYSIEESSTIDFDEIPSHEE